MNAPATSIPNTTKAILTSAVLGFLIVEVEFVVVITSLFVFSFLSCLKNKTAF